MTINYTIEYIGGYLVALTLALGATASVTIFLIEANIITPLLLACSFSCFILNLILFWRSFPSIKKALYKLNLKEVSAILLTLSSCIILHVFTFDSLTSIRRLSYVTQALLPISLIHILTILSSIGNFGLYIDDCRDLINNQDDNKAAITVQHFLYCLVLALIPLIFEPATQILMTLAVCVSILTHEKNNSFCNIIAITATINLAISYYASFSIIHNLTSTYWLQSLIQIIAYVSVFSLTICDSVFGMSIMKDTLSSNSNDELPGSYYAFLSLALLNAIANASISSQSTLLDSAGIIGGIMSFLIMRIQVQELYDSDKSDLPPFSKDSYQPLLILLTNLVIINIGMMWLTYTNPYVLTEILSFLRNNHYLGLTYELIASSIFVGLHTCLFIANTDTAKSEHLPKDHQLNNPTPLLHSDLNSQSAQASKYQKFEIGQTHIPTSSQMAST